ncbi:MAG: TRAP transporter substrate-binding protein DctP, partial [Oxalobacteraceae bacterium]
MSLAHPHSLKRMVAGLAIALASFSSVAAETWSYAIEEVPGSIMDLYAKEFKQRIEKATYGDVVLKIYHMGQLGTSSEMTEQAIDGTINFVNVAVGSLGTLVPESQVFLMNYVLPDNSEAVNKVLASDKLVRGALGNTFEKKGLRLQALYSEGPQVWTTNRVIRKPADFKGFKMRVMVSPVLLDAYADLGASPTPMPFGEVYGALQLKQVDGQVNPV